MARWVVLAALTLVVACGPEASLPLPVSSIPGTDRTVDVSITEFEFHLATTEFRRGETVGFRVVNDGKVSHEFRLTTTAALEHFLFERSEEAGDEEPFDEESILVRLKPGERREVIVTFGDASDPDVLVCVIPGHLEAGMKAELSLVP